MKRVCLLNRFSTTKYLDKKGGSKKKGGKQKSGQISTDKKKAEGSKPSEPKKKSKFSNTLPPSTHTPRAHPSPLSFWECCIHMTSTTFESLGSFKSKWFSAVTVQSLFLVDKAFLHVFVTNQKKRHVWQSILLINSIRHDCHYLAFNSLLFLLFRGNVFFLTQFFLFFF